MELQELYDDQVLNRFIGIAVDEDKMDIKSFRRSCGITIADSV